MLKKILFILAYPFIVYYAFSLPIKIVYLIITDKKGNKRKIKPNTKFNIKQVGQLLFPDLTESFEIFINLYNKNKAKFWTTYKDIQEDKTELLQLELIQLFGDINGKLGFIDWKGEENEFEINEYIEEQIQKKIA